MENMTGLFRVGPGESEPGTNENISVQQEDDKTGLTNHFNHADNTTMMTSLQNQDDVEQVNETTNNLNNPAILLDATTPGIIPEVEITVLPEPTLGRIAPLQEDPGVVTSTSVTLTSTAKNHTFEEGGELEDDEDDDDEVGDEEEEEEEEEKDNDSADESAEADADLPPFTLPGLSSQEPVDDDIGGAAYQVPDTLEWEQQKQGLMRSWMEKLKDKAGYMSGMLVPVGVGVAGALLILAALYSMKIMNRRKRNGFKRHKRKQREFNSMQDRVMLLADSSEDEF
ncbi:hypothetical protein GDO86_016162 [Hymenochirus boettgeri]|uniref:Armadillo-like helical domain-containing protein 4 n=1 Tax=Hymenochirus boettgeri TaxID=247094 RepID=A0A8T2JVX8_9PIPI|nr:hypothetical protein GDO86_016162 [Hymenochirus boettgeri]